MNPRPKRIGYQLTCDKCDTKEGATVYADEGTPAPEAVQYHRCKVTKRQRQLKVRQADGS